MDELTEPEVPTVSAEIVKKAIDNREDFVLLDVRTPGEYARAKIAGSLNIPLDQITCDIESSVPDKNQKVYVYCLSGSRSVHAVDTMIKLGYTNVFDMSHGLMAWRVYRYPMA